MKHYSPYYKNSVIGLTFIKFIKKLWKKWLKIGHVIGNFQIQVIFSLFYLTILSVVSLIIRGMDPLHIASRSKKGKRTSFTTFEHDDETIETAHRQY